MPLPQPLSNSPSSIAKERGSSSAPPPAYQQQHQPEMFTNPDNLDLCNLSTAFEVCDVGQED
jgi:hypothetical protein